ARSRAMMRCRSAACCLGMAIALVYGTAPVAGAQVPVPAYLEYRGDALIGSGTTAQAGMGAVFVMGTYVRTSIDAAGGATWRDGDTRASGRADVIARFLLDPFRESRLGLSLGGGLSVPYVRDEAHVRPFLTAVIDVEGRMHQQITPALQVGL